LIRLVIVAAAAIGLILFVAFVAARLVRSRTAGMSVRLQIFLALAFIVGAFAFGLGLLVLDRIKARANLLGREAALDEARAVAALVSADMKARDATLADVANKLDGEHPAEEPAELHLALFDEKGTPLFSRGRTPEEPGTVAVSVFVVRDEQVVGAVRVVKPTLMINQTLEDFAPTVLIISLLLGAVAAVAAALIGRTIATPIERLTGFAERVSAGERRIPPPPGHGREVKRLARALDSMRRQLQGRPFVEAFAADLSHELKNPVAAIRASAEVLEDGALEDPEQAQQFLSRILESSSRIEALLGDLLSLAKLEARGIEDAVTVDLADCAQRAARTAREQGVEVTIESEGTSTVRGDDAWLTRAVANLIDNARVHGEPNEPIQIAVRSSRKEIRCEVTNAGQVSRHVYGRIFRRFVTTRADRGGTGLGLAIVRAIAEAHGGEAECVTPGPPEVVFRLSLPAA
jgi:signal transduction histidine kinase